MYHLKDYKIDEEGIYYSENERYDEVSYHYVVKFNQPDTKNQLHTFLHQVKLLGAGERTQQIATLLGVK